MAYMNDKSPQPQTEKLPQEEEATSAPSSEHDPGPPIPLAGGETHIRGK